MITITKNVILNKEGLEDIMSVDLNDSKNYSVEEETFLVEARVAFALRDLGLNPNIFVEDTDRFISNEPEGERFIRSNLGRGYRYAVTDMYRESTDKDKIVMKVNVAYPKFIYLPMQIEESVGTFKIDNKRWLKISATPAELKRMLLIFDELKYKRNVHYILGLDIPNNLNHKSYSSRIVTVPLDSFKDNKE